MKKNILLLLSVLSATSCSTLPVQLNNADRLMARPDFPAAASHAPAWVNDALLTINRLEHELESK